MQDSSDVSPAAVHEFRIPPKALLGLHSYCPVHFDAFHSVLVDASVHISLLKGGVHTMKKHRFVSSFVTSVNSLYVDFKTVYCIAFLAAILIAMKKLPVRSMTRKLKYAFLFHMLIVNISFNFNSFISYNLF